MVFQIDENSLYSLFNVNSFDLLETAINTMPPSIIEYYLSDLGNGNDSYLNKKEIEHSINIGEYNLYKNYNNEIFLEIDNITANSFETGSLW